MKVFLLLLVGAFLIPHGVSYAHELKIDDQIGGVFHLEPNHDPIAGQPSTLSYALKDLQGKFRIVDCECVLAAFQSGQEVVSSIAGGTDADVGATIIFPREGTYTVRLSGSPRTKGSFQAFTLENIVEVREPKPTPTPDPTPSASGVLPVKNGENPQKNMVYHYIVGALVGAGLVAALYYTVIARRSSRL
jgi:hypothetical protein